LPPIREIEERIKTYWGREAKELGFASVGEWDKWTEGAIPRFINPTAETPVPLVEFVSWLDPEPLMGLLRDRYKDFDRVKKQLAPRLRFFAYFVLSKETYLAQAYKKLDEWDFHLLDFDKKPNYELLREFVYERIGRNRFKKFFNRIVVQLRIEHQAAGLAFGQRTAQDATDLPSMKNDKEAEYNDYYKEYGYKADVTIGLDQETLPLDYKFMGINEDEGKNLITSQKHLRDMGIHSKEHKIDGSYATFENIAQAEVQNTHLVYRVQDNWVEKPYIDEVAIKKVYQRYHAKDDFRVGANLGFMLRYLSKRGEYELVGNFYRNQIMALDGKVLVLHHESYKERGSKMEGFYGTAKCHTVLGRRPPKRGKESMRFILDLAMLAFVFAALIRVQNGVFDNLGNVSNFG
jgi:hypothetical protein